MGPNQCFLFNSEKNIKLTLSPVAEAGRCIRCAL